MFKIWNNFELLYVLLHDRSNKQVAGNWLKWIFLNFFLEIIRLEVKVLEIQYIEVSCFNILQAI